MKPESERFENERSPIFIGLAIAAVFLLALAIKPRVVLQGVAMAIWAILDALSSLTVALILILILEAIFS